MEISVVSDTNILIDLVDSGLLEQFFSLPMEVHTTDMVIFEVTDPDQKAKVTVVVQQGYLKVKTFTSQEMFSLYAFVNSKRQKSNLSPADFSVWQYAAENHYPLLTGDGNLRKLATTDGVEVHGTLYIFDKLVEHGIITPAQAADRLEALYKTNHRLPKSEVDIRLKRWRGNL